MGTVSILCVYMWGEGVYIVCVHEGGNVCLCIWVLVRLRLCVRSGLRLHLTHHAQSNPTTPPCPAGGGCRRCVGDFSRRGRIARVSAGPLSAVAWRAWPYWPCWAPIGGWGAFGSPGPGPGLPLVWVDCRWSLRACRPAPWGVYTVAVGGHTFGLSSALFWVEAAVVPAVFSWGSRVLGGPRMFGARIFSMPASCLAGWGCCSPHTLLTFTWRNLMNTSAITHTGVHSSIHIGCKNRCSQTPIVLICCCFKTYFVY